MYYTDEWGDAGDGDEKGGGMDEREMEGERYITYEPTSQFIYFVCFFGYFLGCFWDGQIHVRARNRKIPKNQ